MSNINQIDNELNVLRNKLASLEEQKKIEEQKELDKLNNLLKTFDINSYSRSIPLARFREANPQITVRGALVKYVWANLDVKKVAAEKGMNMIGVPAKIVQMAMVEAQKSHPVTEANKKNPSFWEGVKKTAMKL